jgi:hypothetical protein
MDGRAVPGQTSIDHLVIGPGGLWIVDNEAWSPDTRIARYGEKLFFDEKFGTTVAKGLIGAASSLAGLLSKETGIEVTITPVLAVHGGKIVTRDGALLGDVFTGGVFSSGVLTGEGLAVCYPGKVATWIRAHPQGELDPDQIDVLARTAARVLRRMTSVA